MNVIYKASKDISVVDVIQVFRNSGIVRPIDQPERIQAMLDHADILLTAWTGNRMIGVARAITDWSYCCYLSDLAVDKDFQKLGIGKSLIYKVQEEIGDEVSLILLAAPNAMTYYPKVGFDKIENSFIIQRKR
ncbi:GNAT family N-acetyltransferase [Paenibacillus yanchengensis]|uniref:GNAT family N-acetyltransferase n=1 Tax=Paenibacillus yanchengensis TaxID=2035833 RepID=A0ABW4YFB1_9BACL